MCVFVLKGCLICSCCFIVFFDRLLDCYCFVCFSLCVLSFECVFVVVCVFVRVFVRLSVIASVRVCV